MFSENITEEKGLSEREESSNLVGRVKTPQNKLICENSTILLANETTVFLVDL